MFWSANLSAVCVFVRCAAFTACAVRCAVLGVLVRVSRIATATARTTVSGEVLELCAL
jgi:hypothetical protein